MIIENSEIGYLYDKNAERSAFGQRISLAHGKSEIFKSDTFAYTLSLFASCKSFGNNNIVADARDLKPAEGLRKERNAEIDVSRR